MKYLINIASLFLFSHLVAAAPHITYEGTTTHTISKMSSSKSNLKSKTSKQVTLLKIKLSDEIKKEIQANAKRALLTQTSSTKNLPASVQLGMNHTPVLDQGAHGTCATFALFGALDALRGEGDYYSQLCSLNLGKTLAKDGYSPSGWNGQSIRTLLARMDEYGLVSKQAQRENGCGGVTEYPLLDEDNSDAIPLDVFHAMSEPYYYSGLNEWSTIFDIAQWMSKQTSMDSILDRTKTSLYYGNRIVIGTLLPIIDGDVGFLGTHQVQSDALVLTPRIEQAIQFIFMEYTNWGGHAMIITGYDDNAIATDNEGRVHKGLFTLRNSWGAEVGNNGDFYMSYDYFKALAIELEVLIKIAP